MKNLRVKIELLSVVFLLMLVFSIFVPTKSALGIKQYFGGKIILMVPCTCSSGYQLTLYGFGTNSGTYWYNDFAKKYRNYSVINGKWVLGSYTPGGVCMVGVAPFCTLLPISKGTITSIATS